MRKIKLYALFALAMLPLSALCEEIAVGLSETLKSKYPNTRFDDIRESALPGVFEVIMGRNVAYTNREGRYFLFGHVYDMQERRDVTADRMAELEKKSQVDFSKLPLSDAIKSVHGNGSRRIAVFSDPDCPYCREVEKSLQQVADVTIYTFMNPINMLHPQAEHKAISVWCANDRAGAWADLMLHGKQPTPANCDNPVQRNIALAASLGFQGTPTLVSGDGKIMPGAAPAEKINAWLQDHKAVGANP